MVKKHFFIFSLSDKQIVNAIDIVMDGQRVFPVSHSKFLGVNIDENLNWPVQVNN